MKQEKGCLLGRADSSFRAVLADQIKSLDLKVREAEKKGKVSKEIQEEVLEKLKTLID